MLWFMVLCAIAIAIEPYVLFVVSAKCTDGSVEDDGHDDVNVSGGRAFNFGVYGLRVA